MKFPSKLERMLDAGAIVEWRPVKDFEGYYEINNVGDVKSIARVDSNNHPVRERILKSYMVGLGYLEGRGYLAVTLHKEGERRIHKVHRLVTEAFIGECPEGKEVNHINERKTDNRLDNLEYVTRKQNLNHGTRPMRFVRAVSHPVESYNLSTGETIRKYPSAHEAARLDGYSQGCINQCIKGRQKSHHGVGWRRSEV